MEKTIRKIPYLQLPVHVEQGITIHTVGVGTQQGAPIPVYQNNQIIGISADAQGNTVISRFDEPMLQTIAQQRRWNFSNRYRGRSGFKQNCRANQGYGTTGI
jgi:hypothetical protein